MNRIETKNEIKTAVAAGKRVHWKNMCYRVLTNWTGDCMIHCDFTGYSTPLTADYNPKDFFIVQGI
jgi:hypothetical protein